MPYDPIAAPRSSPEKTATMMARALGVSRAPKIPCSARKAMSASIDGESAQPSDTMPKPATPSAKIRRSPKRSPSEPPTRIREPSVSR